MTDAFSEHLGDRRGAIEPEAGIRDWWNQAAAADLKRTVIQRAGGMVAAIVRRQVDGEVCEEYWPELFAETGPVGSWLLLNAERDGVMVICGWDRMAELS